MLYLAREKGVEQLDSISTFCNKHAILSFSSKKVQYLTLPEFFTCCSEQLPDRDVLSVLSSDLTGQPTISSIIVPLRKPLTRCP